LKRILLMLLTGGFLTLLGCANAPGKIGKNESDKEFQVTGKYVNAITSDIYIELKEDGTFYDKFGKRSSHGKYVIDGNRVIFTSASGKTFEFVIEGKSLISKEGARLIRQ
jgi:hypothetical protein